MTSSTEKNTSTSSQSESNPIEESISSSVPQSNTSIPQDGTLEQSLVFKSVNGQDISLSFLPPTKTVYEKAPIYFIISGGGWASCNRENMIAFSGYSVRKLREKGFAVISVDYRLYGDGAVMEDMVSDVMDAARYAKKYEEILKVDADKIITSGHSAGGQLALMLAYAPHDFVEESALTKYDFTVIGTAPLSAPTVMYPDSDVKFLSFTTDHLFSCKQSDSEEGRRGSPITYAGSKKIPTLLIAGEKDEIVYKESSELFFQEVTKAGGSCQLIICKNGGHSFEAIVQGEGTDPAPLVLQNEIVKFAEALVK